MSAREADRLGLRAHAEADPAVTNAWTRTRTWTPGDRPVEVREYLPVRELGFALTDGRREEPLGCVEVDDPAE